MRTSGSAAIKSHMNNSIPNCRNRYSPGCPPEQTKNKYHDLYTRRGGTIDFSMVLGGGLDPALNRTSALRVPISLHALLARR